MMICDDVMIINWWYVKMIMVIIKMIHDDVYDYIYDDIYDVMIKVIYDVMIKMIYDVYDYLLW